MRMSNQNTKNDYLIASAFAKINLHLEILGLRNDGYHELSMVMQSIDLCDQLRMKSSDDNKIILNSSNPELTIGDDNLIIKAAKLLRNKSGMNHLGVNINLIKNIPIGAGLAGGSTDAAATLVGLNRLWSLKFNMNQLEEIAKEIGSDVPFCISGGRQLCFGRGELLEKVNNKQSTIGVILVKDPSIQISTPMAYKRYKDQFAESYLSSEVEFENKRNEARSFDWSTDKFIDEHKTIQNDLQKTISPITPEVRNSLTVLKDLPGLKLASMSGSGPSCYALFSTYNQAKIVLNQNLSKFENAGLSAWACSMKSFGVELKNEII